MSESPSAELDGRGDDDTDDAVADTLGDMFKSMVIDGSAPRRPSADVRDEAIDLLHSLGWRVPELRWLVV